MRHLTSNTRVLVVSDNTDDAQLIQRQLSGNFTQVKVSTDAERCLQEFERHSPEVLVLAFDRLDKAQRYYLGLYRLGSGLLQHPHRTVILCSKEEVHAVFELCKQAHFDDYVLYWPHSQDGSRLAMSVWNAGRQASGPRTVPPQPTGPQTPGGPLVPRDHLLGSAPAQAAASSMDMAFESQAQTPARPAKPAPLLAQGRVRRVVMVVDDDEFARMLVEQVLDPQVWETQFAFDGAAALVLLERQRPDVILMDLHLPGLDGVSLTHRLKASPLWAAIPIVMMTGDACKSALLRSMEAGAVSFVVKPFTRDSLASKLQAALVH